MRARTFVLAGGCFWCLDAIYRSVRGVGSVTAGFAGGSHPAPTIELVSKGDTGHAEVVAVTFDADVVPESVVLDIFFAFHDPTQLNGQGDLIGTHYRSAVFYADDGQKALFKQAIEKAAASWEDSIVTQLEPLRVFYPAEESQQNFFARNPNDAFCQTVTQPKVTKLRASFAEYLKG